jgi:hypothetical protein
MHGAINRGPIRAWCLLSTGIALLLEMAGTITELIHCPIFI